MTGTGFKMAEVKGFWEVERIGIVIACSCVIMILVNRLHKYIPCLKCWKKGKVIKENVIGPKG